MNHHMTTLYDKLTSLPDTRRQRIEDRAEELFRQELQVMLARTINLCLAVDESCSLSDFVQLKDIAARLRDDVDKMQSYITRG